METLARILLLFRCRHIWEIYNERDVEIIDEYDNLIDGYKKIILRCTICGELKSGRY